MWFWLGFCPSVPTLGSKKLLDLLQKYSHSVNDRSCLGYDKNCGMIKSIKLWIKCYPFKYHVTSCHELKPSSGSEFGWYCKSWKEKVLIFKQNLKSLLYLPLNWKLTMLLKPCNWHVHPGYLHSFLPDAPISLCNVLWMSHQYDCLVQKLCQAPSNPGVEVEAIERLLVTPLAHQCTMNDEAQYPSLHICITCPNNSSSRYTSHSHGNHRHTPKQV